VFGAFLVDLVGSGRERIEIRIPQEFLRDTGGIESTLRHRTDSGIDCIRELDELGHDYSWFYVDFHGD
jgi:hypothetical protein